MTKDNVVILGAGNPLLAPVDILERVRPWVQDGIRSYALGTPVSYAISFGIMPGPDGNPTPRVMLYFETASGILGAPPIAHVVMCDTFIPQDRVDAVCKAAVEQVMAMRSEQLRISGNGKL